MDKTIGILVSALVVSIGMVVLHGKWRDVRAVAEPSARAVGIEEEAEELAMPPGYSLVTNQIGQWRAKDDRWGVIVRPFSGESDGTRKQAIRRAQEQYEFECERDATKWIKAE